MKTPEEHLKDLEKDIERELSIYNHYNEIEDRNLYLLSKLILPNSRSTRSFDYKRSQPKRSPLDTGCDASGGCELNQPDQGLLDL
jgi:hypothetical protein